MDKLEKFEELYIKTLNQSRRFGIFGINDEDYEQYDKDKQELIKMYNEKKEKPVIRCKELYVNMNSKYGYEIQFINLKNHEVKTYKGTLSCKEKYGMLITDDFIFIKE